MITSEYGLDSFFHLLLNNYKEYDWAMCPVVVEGHLYYENQKRPLDHYMSRLSLFPELSGSLLDLGCNNGFNLLQLKERNRLTFCCGVDKSIHSINLANFINTYENKDIAFIKTQFIPFLEHSSQYDYILYMDVNSYYDSLYRVDFDMMMKTISKKTKKSFFVEPTNFEQMSREEIDSFYTEYFSQFGTVKLLGYSDFQNRGLFQIIL